MDLDKSKVIVMNTITCALMQDTIAEEALNSTDPLGYLARYNGIPVIIDDSLPDNYVEVYEKWMYDAVQKWGKA
jgi:hypothetical protein